MYADSITAKYVTGMIRNVATDGCYSVIGDDKNINYVPGQLANDSSSVHLLNVVNEPLMRTEDAFEQTATRQRGLKYNDLIAGYNSQ